MMEIIGNVELGIDCFLNNHISGFKNAKIGLVCNHASLNSNLIGTADLLIKKNNLNIVKIFAPEHGINGLAEAGEQVNSYIDGRYGIPVFSLYDQTKTAEFSGSESLDESMRRFDVLKAGKTADPDLLSGLDTIIFDLQDVGTRIYTYASTLLYLMESCADNGIEIIVLDRPNPINGSDIEGPILKYPEYSSFIGAAPIPLRHSLTMGELSNYFNNEILEKPASLKVIPMKLWKRDLWFDETGLSWINPSPNLPSLESVTVYPGQVLFEGTNVSEGRGTTLPFELFGAPWINGNEIKDKLNNLNLEGVKFIDVTFSPVFSKFSKEVCYGIRIVVTNRNIYKPFITALHIISILMNSYPSKFIFHDYYFDRVCGKSSIRQSLLKGISPEEICENFTSELKHFENMRLKYLLYS